jgi:hypothetical protein
MTREERKKLKREQRKKQELEERRRQQLGNIDGVVSGGSSVLHGSIAPPQLPPVGVGGGGGGSASGRQPMGNGNVYVDHGGQMMLDQEEVTAVSLGRKYGYAIMALSVVVLAVLMVSKTKTVSTCKD